MTFSLWYNFRTHTETHQVWLEWWFDLHENQWANSFSQSVSGLSPVYWNAYWDKMMRPGFDQRMSHLKGSESQSGHGKQTTSCAFYLCLISAAPPWLWSSAAEAVPMQTAELPIIVTVYCSWFRIMFDAWKKHGNNDWREQTDTIKSPPKSYSIPMLLTYLESVIL